MSPEQDQPDAATFDMMARKLADPAEENVQWIPQSTRSSRVTDLTPQPYELRLPDPLVQAQRATAARFYGRMGRTGVGGGLL